MKVTFVVYVNKAKDTNWCDGTKIGKEKMLVER